MIHRESCLIEIVAFSDKRDVLEPSGGASGQASDIAIHAREILRVREMLTGIYQKHCGKEGESLEEGLARFGSYILFLFLSFTVYGLVSPVY